MTSVTFWYSVIPILLFRILTSSNLRVCKTLSADIYRRQRAQGESKIEGWKKIKRIMIPGRERKRTSDLRERIKARPWGEGSSGGEGMGQTGDMGT